MRRLVIPSVIILLLIGAAQGQSGAVEHNNGLEVFGSAVMKGSSEFSAGEGAVVFPSSHPTDVQLQADSIEVVTQWRTGTAAGIDRNLVDLVTDDGVDRRVFSDVEVRFDRFDGNEGVFLPFSEGSSRLSTSFLDHWEVFPDSDPLVVGVGDSPDTQEAGNAETIGFWYEAPGPQVVMLGGGTLRLDGDFDLFVHDVRILASGTEGDWSDWTGYREHQDDRQPAKEYEFRITTIQVHNGTFLASPREMTFYAPQVHGTFDGGLSAPSATGRLLQDGTAHVFKEDPLHLKGSGTVGFETVEGAREGWSNILVEAEGDFEIRGARNVDAVDMPGGSIAEVVPTIAVAGLILASATSTGLARHGFLPVPVAPLRYRWHRMWMDRGRQCANRGLFPRAARHYHRAVRLEPSEPLAWYEWAHAELLADRMERVDRIAIRARAVPGMDPLDLLDLQASAALARGDMDHFERCMESIAMEAPELAQGLIRELEVDASKLSPGLRGMIGTRLGPGEEGEIDGYA